MNEIEARLRTKLLAIDLLSLPELERVAVDRVVVVAQTSNTEADFVSTMITMIRMASNEQFARHLHTYMMLALRK